MRFFVYTLLVALITSCNSEGRKVEYSKIDSVDSLISLFEENPADHKYATNQIIRFYYGGEKTKALDLLERISTSPILQTEENFWSHRLTDWGFYYLWENQLDSTQKYVQRWKSTPNNDVTNRLVGIQLEGSYYFMKGMMDSARSSFEGGYTLAKTKANDVFIERFANNLGAIAFQSTYYGTAAFYFSEAYKLNRKNNTSNPILLNNLAACYLNEGLHEKAIDILSSLKELIDINNVTYEGILTKVNFTNALIVGGQIKKANRLIQSVNWQEIPEALRGDFLVNELKILDKTGFKGFPSLVEKYKNELAKYRVRILKKQGGSMVELYDIHPEIYSILQVNELKNELGNSDWNLEYRYYQLKSKEAKRRGKNSQAFEYMLRSNEARRKYNQLSDSIKLTDTRTNIDLIEAREELKRSESELLYAKRINSRNQTIIFLLFLLAVIVSSFLYILYRNRNHKYRLAELEVEAKTREKEFLEEEKRLNSRITTLSKIIIDKSKQLAKTIKEGPYSNEPEIFNVQKELEQMSLIDATVNIQPQVIEVEKEQMYLSLDPIKSLNETQIRVLILSVEKYRPKEIATTLNLTYAYVRNVQVKLRKIIRDMGLNSFEELKKV